MTNLRKLFSSPSQSSSSERENSQFIFPFANILMFDKYIFSRESFSRNWIIFSFSFQSIFSLKPRLSVSANFIRNEFLLIRRFLLFPSSYFFRFSASMWGQAWAIFLKYSKENGRYLIYRYYNEERTTCAKHWSPIAYKHTTEDPDMVRSGEALLLLYTKDTLIQLTAQARAPIAGARYHLHFYMDTYR